MTSVDPFLAIVHTKLGTAVHRVPTVPELVHLGTTICRCHVTMLVRAHLAHRHVVVSVHPSVTPLKHHMQQVWLYIGLNQGVLGLYSHMCSTGLQLVSVAMSWHVDVMMS